MLDISLTQFYPSLFIRYAKIDGLYVILDLSSENYLIFDDAATDIWDSLFGEGRSERSFAEKYLGEEKEKLVAFLESCIERNLISSEPISRKICNTRQAPMRSQKFSLAFAAWMNIFRTVYSLRRKGFSHTYNEYAQLSPIVEEADAVLLRGQAELAFLRAENFFWHKHAPEDCLPRSLALYRFLHSLGLLVVHRIGGRRVPTFCMHAWVEHEGTVVLDDPRNRTQLTVLSTIP